MHRRILAALFFTLLGVGLACRNLDLPGQGNIDGGNSGPEIAFLTPRDGERVGLRQLFALDVEDVNGVRAVRLSCANQPLHDWSAEADGGEPSYQASVDLSGCQDGGVTVTSADGTVLQRIAVLAEAWDRLDAGSQRAIALDLDTTVANVQLNVPPRVQPRGPVTILIQSDHDLQGPPLVTLDGVPSATPPASVDGGRRTYRLVTTAPGLGVDNWTGAMDADVPIEVLTEVERPFPISVDAVASSGIVSHVQAPVLLSRLAWQAGIPGFTYPTPPQAALPVATDGGVQIAMPTGGTWVPGFFTAQDGTFIPFQPTAIDPASYSAQAFDSAGRTAVANIAKGDFVFLAPGTNAVVNRYSVNPSLLRSPPAYVRVGDTLCFEQYTDFYCPGGVVRTLTCVGANTGIQTSTVDAGTDYGTQATGLHVGSGNVYLGTNVANCTTAYNGVNADVYVSPPGGPGNVTLFPGTVTPGDVQRLAPVGDGTFILQSAGSETVLVNALGNVIGTYPPRSASATLSVEVAAAPNSYLLRWSSVPPYSVLELWGAGASSTSVRGRLPNIQLPVRNAAVSALANQAVFKSTGELAMLVQTATAAYGLAVFDANLQPRWLYRHPLSIGSGVPQLAADESSQRLYFIDPYNGQVVAFVW